MSPRHNALLQPLPPQEYERFLPYLELMSLSTAEVLIETGEMLAYVYFPVGAVVSIICELDNGLNIESNMVGKNSMVGLTFTGTESFYKAEVRNSGLAYRLKASTCRQLSKQCPTFSALTEEAKLAALRYTSFTGACARHHTVEQQLLRWILISLDRGFDPSIRITHADVSRLLGFRREAITLTLGRLVEAGGIKLRRGEIEVIDRPLIERMACECYWRITEKKRLSFTDLTQVGVRKK